jgi:hypothetical protein
MLKENADIADRLDEAAKLLVDQRANRFRVTAYADAAATVRQLDKPVREIFEFTGHNGLVALPTIGDSIARAIAEMLLTGRWAFLERLKGESEPEVLFRTIPGIGPKRAEAIESHLHIDTLEELEEAAHDGRLAKVPGIGQRTISGIRDALSARFPQARRNRRQVSGREPEVALLLEVDKTYRDSARDDQLPRIAPGRSGRGRQADIPILHMEAGGWMFTALYSNTATARRFGRTRDWVIISFSLDHEHDGQRTVVTETRGPLEGQRVIRGREAECGTHYAGMIQDDLTRVSNANFMS